MEFVNFIQFVCRGVRPVRVRPVHPVEKIIRYYRVPATFGTNVGELYDDDDIYRTFRYPFTTFNTTIYNGSMTTRPAAYRAAQRYHAILQVDPDSYPVSGYLRDCAKARYVFRVSRFPSFRVDESSTTSQHSKIRFSGEFWFRKLYES